MPNITTITPDGKTTVTQLENYVTPNETADSLGLALDKGIDIDPIIVEAEGSQYDKDFLPYPSLTKSYQQQLYKHRANQQSGWDQFGNVLAKGAIGALSSVVEPIGHLTDFETIFKGIANVEGEVGNNFNRALTDLQGQMQEQFPVYTEEEQPTILSGQWWTKYGDQFIKSLGYFIPAMGLTKAIGAGLKGLQFTRGISALGQATKIPALAKYADAVTNLASAAGSATLMNYSEHMLSATEAFDTNRQKYFAHLKKLNPDTADEILQKQADKMAGQDAAEIVQKGKWNIAFETLEYFNLFKGVGKAARSYRPASLLNKVGAVAQTSGSEAAQEVVTGYLESEAQRNAKIFAGEMEPDNSTGLDRFVEHMTSYEGLTEGILGALGGGSMQLASFVMDRGSGQYARDVMAKNASELGNGAKVKSIKTTDFFELAFENATAGTYENFVTHLEDIANMEDEKADQLNIDKEDAKQKLKLALEFEDEYNTLHNKYKEKPAWANALLIEKLRHKAGAERERMGIKGIREVHKKMEDRTMPGDTFPLIQKRFATIKGIQSAIYEINDSLNELEDKKGLYRDSHYLDTRKDLESRKKILTDKLNEEIDGANSLYDTVFEKNTYKGDNPIFIDTDGSIKAPAILINSYNEILDENQSELEEFEALKYHGWSQRVTAQNKYSRLSENEELLNEYVEAEDKFNKERRDKITNTVRDKLKKVTTKEELNKVREEHTEPYLDTLYNDKLKEIDRNTKREQDKQARDKAKNKKKSPTPSSPTGDSDPIINRIKNASYEELPKIRKDLQKKGKITEEYEDAIAERFNQLDDEKIETVSPSKQKDTRDIEIFTLDDIEKELSDETILTDNNRQSKVGLRIDGIDEGVIDKYGRFDELDEEDIETARKEISELIDRLKKFQELPGGQIDTVKFSIRNQISSLEIALDGLTYMLDNIEKEVNVTKPTNTFEKPNPAGNTDNININQKSLSTKEDSGDNVEVSQSSGKKVYINKKIIPGANAVAKVSRESKTVEFGDGTTNRIPISNEKAPGFYTDLETTQFDIGAKLKFEIVGDEETIKNDPYNVQIAIKYVLGDQEIDMNTNLHTLDWISAKDETGEYKNIVEFLEEGNVNNAEIQINNIKDIRKKIIDNHNKGIATYTKVTDKTIGHPSYRIALDIDGNPIMKGKWAATTYLPLTKAFKNKDIDITILRKERFEIAKGQSWNRGEIVNNVKELSDDYEGVPFAILPTPVRGKYFAVPLIIPKIKELGEYSNIREDVRQLYTNYSKDSGEQARILLNKYVYLHDQKLDSTDIPGVHYVINVSEKEDSQGMLVFGNTEDQIYYSTKVRKGKLGFYKNNKELKSDSEIKEFWDQFDSHLEEQYFSTKLNMLQDKEYVDFIKGILQTNILETNAKNGNYVYFDNPNIIFGDIAETTKETNEEKNKVTEEQNLNTNFQMRLNEEIEALELAMKYNDRESINSVKLDIKEMLDLSEEDGEEDIIINVVNNSPSITKSSFKIVTPLGDTRYKFSIIEKPTYFDDLIDITKEDGSDVDLDDYVDINLIKLLGGLALNNVLTLDNFIKLFRLLYGYNIQIENEVIDENRITIDFETETSQEEPTTIKPGVSELFEINPELAKVGTQQQYSQYLDTIFPDSKVKDIVYHGTDVFKKQNVISGYDNSDGGIFFTDNINYAKSYARYRNGNLIIHALLNIINPAREKDLDGLFGYLNEDPSSFPGYGALKPKFDGYISNPNYDTPDDTIYTNDIAYKKDKAEKEKLKKEATILNIKDIDENFVVDGNYGIQADAYFNAEKKLDELGIKYYTYAVDTIKGIAYINNVKPTRKSYQSINYLVFEPEQIHILGSKQDIAGFKEFVNKQEKSTGATIKKKRRTLFDELDTQNDEEESFLMDDKVDAIKEINEDHPLAKEMNKYRISGFLYEQQYDILNYIVYKISSKEAQLQRLIEGGKLSANTNLNVNNTLNNIKRIFEDTYEEFKDSTNTKERFYSDESKKIVDNWDAFVSLTMQNIHKLGLEVVGEELEGEESNYEKSKWDDNARFERDVKDTASSNFKLFLSRIQDVEWNSDRTKLRAKRNYLGLHKYVGFDTLFDDLSYIFADQDPSLMNFLTILDRESLTKPIFKRIHDELLKADNQLRADFVASMAKTSANFVMLVKGATKQWDRYTGQSSLRNDLKIMASNQNSAVNNIERAWAENQKDLAISITNDRGQYMINPAEVIRIRNKYIAALEKAEAIKNDKSIPKNKRNKVYQEDWFIDEFLDMLASQGIIIPRNAIPELISKSRTYLGNSWEESVRFTAGKRGRKVESFVRWLFDAYEKDVSKADEDMNPIELNNPLFGDSKESKVTKLAKLTFKHTPRIYSHSHSNIMGNTLYTLQNHNKMSLRMMEILNNPTKRKNILNTSFGKDSIWLQQIESGNENVIDTIRLEFADGLKNKGQRYGTRPKDMQSADLELTAIGFFQNSGAGEKGSTSGISKFITPTHSDKGPVPIITMQRQEILRKSDGTLDITFDEKDNLVLGKTARTLLMNQVRAEMDRIDKFQRVIKPKIEEERKTKGNDYNPIGVYEQGADKFILFNYLNKDSLSKSKYKDKVGEIWLDNKFNPSAEGLALIEQIVAENVQNEIEAAYNYWKSIGVIRYDKNNKFQRDLFDTVYKRRLKLNNLSREQRHKAMAADMVVNYQIANVEYYRIFAGDPAKYWKSNVETTLKNMQKRLAGDVSPIIIGNFEFEIDGVEKRFDKYRKITINDKIVDSDLADSYAKLLGEDLYRNIEVTDAQEYTTVEEAVAVKVAYGRIPTAIAKSILDKVYAAKKNGTYYYELNDIEKTWLLNPDKPLNVHDEYEEEYDYINTTYTKSSSLALLPEATKDHEIDKLRVAMEKNNISRAAYKTADKVGAVNIANVWKGGKLEVNITEDNIREFDRSGFGIQQEMPQGKNKILVVSQMDKLLFNNIRNVNFGTKDNPIFGRDLEKRKEAIRSQLSDMNKHKLMDDIGAKLSLDDLGNITVEFKEGLSKIQEILKQEARDREWSLVELDYLELSEDETEFIIPPAFGISSDRIESLLLSLVKNRIMKLELLGKGYVQATSAGWNGIKTFEDYTEDEQNDINNNVITTDQYDHSKGLQHIRVDENREVRAAQVFVPNFFMYKGNKINIRKFTKKVNGKTMIDFDKMPRELLQLIGARIPNQDHNSMIPLEVVGFLPDRYGDTIIVSPETVKQMGSDFDIDKLYVYFRDYNYKNGKLSKYGSEESTQEETEINQERLLKAEYVDIHWQVLTHPEVIKRVLSPIDKDDLKLERDEIIKGRPTSNPLSWSYQRDSYIMQQSGKQLIAFLANWNTFSAAIQDYNLALQKKQGGTLNKSFVTFKVGDKELKLNKLSGIGKSKYGTSDRFSSDNLSILLNAAVDNANDPLAFDINLNNNTVNVYALLSMLKDEDGNALSLEESVAFMTQPAIIEYVDKLNELTNTLSINNRSHSENEQFAFNIVNKKYKDIVGKDAKRNANKAYSAEELKQIRKSSGKEFAQHQLNILAKFQDLLEITKDLQLVRQAIHFASVNAAGTNLFQTSEMIGKVNKAGSEERRNNRISNVAELLGEFGEDGRFIGPTTQNGTITYNTLFLAQAMYGRLFPYFNPTFSGIEEMIEAETLRTSELTEKDRHELWNAFRSFVISGYDELFLQDIEVKRTTLLYDTKDNKSLATELNELKNTDFGKNNYLLQRLIAVHPNDKNDPARIEYSSALSQRLDDIENTRALVSMLMSKNERISKFAENLIAYSFLTGGVKSSISFIRYIPVQYMESMIPYGSKLRELQRTDFDDGTFSTFNFLKQYFQHNPGKAARIVDELGDEVIMDNIRTSNKLPVQFTLRNPSNEDLTQYLKDRLIENPDTGEHHYPRYLSMEIGFNDYLLYEQSGKDTEGNVIYKQISTKGYAVPQGFGISEYNVALDTISKIKANQCPLDKQRQALKTGEIMNSDSTTENIKVSTTNEYHLRKLFGDVAEDIDVDVTEVLDNITADNPSYELVRAVRQIVEDIATKPGYDKLTISMRKIVRDRDGNPAKGRYARGRIQISLTANKTEDEVIHTILHEIHHGFVNQTIFSKEEAPHQNTFAQNRAVTKLQELKEFLENNHKKLVEEYSYAFENLKEFAAEAMSNKRFQLRLNNIKYNDKKTALEQLLDTIVRFVQAIGEFIGIEVKAGSALESAIHSIVTMSGIERFGELKPTEVDFLKDTTTIKDIQDRYGILDEKGNPIKRDMYVSVDLAKKINYEYPNFTATTERTSDGKYTVRITENNENPSYLSKGASRTRAIRTQIEYRIRDIQDGLTRSMDRETRRKLYSDIKKLRMQLQSLSADSSKEAEAPSVAIGKIAEEQLTWAAKIADSDKINPRQLELAFKIIDTWQTEFTFKHFLTDSQRNNPENSLHELFLDIGGKAYSIKERLHTKSKNFLLNLANKLSNRPNLTMEELMNARDITWAMGKNLDISRIPQPLVQLIYQLTSSSGERNHHVAVTNEINLIKEATKKLKSDKNAMAIVGNNFDIFWQKDKDGVPNGMLTNEWSPTWWDTLKEASATLNKEKEIAYKINNSIKRYEALEAAYKKYERFKNKNTIIINPRITKYADVTGTDYSSRQEYIDYLNSQYGSELTQQLINEAEEKYLLYERDLARETELIENDDTKEDKEKEIEDWINNNNPIVYIKSKYTSKYGFTTRSAAKYSVEAPLININGKSTGYLDENYVKISSNETVNEFYKFTREKLENYAGDLPKYALQNRPNLMLPMVQNSVVADIFNQKSLRGMAGAISKSIVDYMTDSEIAELEQAQERSNRQKDENNREVNKIPIKFLGKFENKEDIEKTSRDIPEILMLFAGMTINYNYKNAVEPQVQLAMRLLNEVAEVAYDAKGRPRTDRDGATLKYEKGILKIKEAVKYHVDAVMYGIKKERKPVSSRKLYPLIAPQKEIAERYGVKLGNLNDAAKRRKVAKAIEIKHEELERELENNQDQIDNPEVPVEVKQMLIERNKRIQETIDQMSEDYRKLEGKNITWASGLEAVLKFTQLKGMALNLTAGIANMGFGMISNIVHANGRKEFTPKDLLKAMGVMMSPVGIKKAVALINGGYNVLFDIDETRFGKDKISVGKFKTLERIDPYIVQTKTELFVQGVSAVAQMMGKKIKVKINGEEKTIRVWDLYKDDGTLRTDIDQQTKRNWEMLLSPGAKSTEFTSFRNTVLDINKRLHGNYDNMASPIEAKRYLIGRMLYQFRSWIPEGIFNRFGKRQYNDILGREIQGRWDTYGELGLWNSVWILIKQGMHLSENIAFKRINGQQLDTVEIENMRKNLAEVGVAVAMFGFMLMLRGALKARDDDEDKAILDYTYTLLANQIWRIQSDIYFYLSPSTFENIIRNPLPVFKTYKDFEYFVHGWHRYETDEDYRGQHPTTKFMKLLPFTNQIPKIKFQSERIIAGSFN